MNFSRIMALSSRIVQQVFRDKRTLALIFIVPIFIMPTFRRRVDGKKDFQ